MNPGSRPPVAVGNPVRRDLALRSLRSNTNATLLAVWTVLIAAVAAIVLIQQIGLRRPFDAEALAPAPVGRALAQWWIVSITVGTSLFAAIGAAVACAGHGEHRRLAGWATTLVGSWRVVIGIWQQQVALLLLALVLALPVAAIALAAGGTSVLQLGVGIAGAALSGFFVSAMTIAISCRSPHVLRPLTVTLVIVIACYAVPFGVHQARGSSATDPVLAVVPVVAVADAAAPRAPGPPARTGAADAPLEHLRANVAPWDGQVPAWAWAAGGAVAGTLVLLLIARIRIGRPPRQ